MSPLIAASAATPAGGAVVVALDDGGALVVGAAVDVTPLDETVGPVEGTACRAAGEPPSPSPSAAIAMPGTAAITTIEMAARNLWRLDQESTREERRCRFARELVGGLLTGVPAWRSSPSVRAGSPILGEAAARREGGAQPSSAGRLAMAVAEVKDRVGQSGRSGILWGCRAAGVDMTEFQSEWAGPTVRRMLVGAKLRRLRTDIGLSREEAAQAIRASAWKIHRLENGQVGFKQRDLVDLLERYGVTDPDEIDELLTLAREANVPGWWQHYGDVLPQWFRTYVDLESAATLIRTYEGMFVPGLLQTDDYMRAVIHGAHLEEPPEEVGRKVRLRMARQILLTREHPPRLWAVVDEAALRRPVGGPAVMKGQLQRLLEATELPNVTLQILPFDAGAHAAMVGSFSVLRFPDQELPDVVYLEHISGASYLNKPDEVDQYLHVMESICVRAAAPDQTVELLEKLLDDL